MAKTETLKMMRAALGILLVLACAGCAVDDGSQAAAVPGCRTANPQNRYCRDQTSDQSGDQLSVHVGGTVSYGMVGAVR